MTAEIAILNKNGIALAADSKVTIGSAGQDKDIRYGQQAIHAFQGSSCRVDDIRQCRVHALPVGNHR